MKSKFALVLAVLFVVSCSSSSSDRASIVSWAKQIASIQNRLQAELDQAQPLLSRITARPPTSSELDELVDYNNRITALYNELIEVEPPEGAKATHAQYVETYARTTDYVRYYVIAIKENDLSYFDKSVTAAQEANRLAEGAHNAFEALLNRYSISCEEVDFCE